MTIQTPPIRYIRDTFGGVQQLQELFPLSQILKTKHLVLEASSIETTQLKKKACLF
jgi:hypothetical protein